MPSVIEVSSTSSIADDDDLSSSSSSPVEWLWLQLKADDNEYITIESLKRHVGDGVSDTIIQQMLQGKDKLTREEFEAVYSETGLSVDEHGLPVDNKSKH